MVLKHSWSIITVGPKSQLVLSTLGPKAQLVHCRDQVKKGPTDFRTNCVLGPSEALPFEFA